MAKVRRCTCRTKTGKVAKCRKGLKKTCKMVKKPRRRR